MSEVLSIEEMRRRFPDEWVLIGELVSEEQTLNPLAGKVLYHGRTREEAYRKAVELRPARFAVRFMGDLSSGTDVWITPFLSEPGPTNP